MLLLRHSGILQGSKAYFTEDHFSGGRPPEKAPAEQVVEDIRRATRRQFSAEEKIRIVLEGVRGEESIAELCRREGIASSMDYGWSKEFLDAGKRRLAGDTARAATSDEVKELRREAQALKEAVADLTPENRLLKKTYGSPRLQEIFLRLFSLRQRIRVWMAPSLARENRRWSCGTRLQSCVRPFRAARRPLALMGVRGLGPHRSRGFVDPGYVSGFSQRVGTAAHSITSLPSQASRFPACYAAGATAGR
jgi:transposase